MFTFMQIYEMALNRVNEDTTSPNATVLAVIKAGVNQGYMLMAATVDKRTTTVDMPSASSVPLPLDIIEVVNLSHSVIGDLSPVDYKGSADLLYIKSQDIGVGVLTLTYAQYPSQLVADSDVVHIKDGLASALASYAGYTYQLYRKKYSAAQLLFAEFQSFQGLSTQFIPIPNE